MKAVTFKKYGSPNVLSIVETDKPLIKEDQILIKIYSTSVTMGDCELRKFDFPLFLWPLLRIAFGIFRPRYKILGQELAGVVAEIGNKTSKFKVGDRIFGSSDFRMGTYSEYKAISEKAILTKLDHRLSFDEGGVLAVGAINASYFLKDVKINKGDKMLLIGAGGSIGTIALQLATLNGASVTAVDTGEKLAMLKNIGANEVIDYTKESYYVDEEKYNIIFDVVGKSKYNRSVIMIKDKGYYIIANPNLSYLFRAKVTNLKNRIKVITGVADENYDYLNNIQKLIIENKIKVIIDKTYPLEDIIEAHTYVEQGHKKGNVVIKVVEE